MEFYINGIKGDIETKGKTIGNILSELDEKAETTGTLICKIKKDGVDINAETIADIFGIDAETEGVMELETQSSVNMKINALQSILAILSSTEKALTNNEAEALDNINKTWESYVNEYGDLFSAEEMSFIEDFQKQMQKSHSLEENNTSLTKLNNLSRLFSERLFELEYPKEAMLGAAKLFDSIKDELEEVPVKIQTGKDNEAMKTMVIIIELINKTIRILPEFASVTNGTMLIDGKSIEDFYSAFNDVLNELAQAFENKDGVLIGDIAEYEIKPRMESFFLAIKEA